MKYKVPEYGSKMFSCPTCGALAQQEWRIVEFERDFVPGAGWREEKPRIARCVACGKKSFWNDGVLIYPRQGSLPEHDPDMPEAVLELYREASEVAAVSPRTACAMLRLAFEKLFALLESVDWESSGSDKENLQLPEAITEALTAVRVEGKDAVPAGMICSEGDNARTAQLLSELLNLVVEYAISNKRRLSDLGRLLPYGHAKVPLW